MSKLILVTGGSGYIGTHCLVELLKDGYNVFVVDNEYNSSFESLKRVELISGKQVPFVKLNLNDKQNLNALFKANQFYAVLHLAAFKAVGESTGKPLEYYSNNVASTICLLECMKENNVKNLVFSSSCTVYGKPQYLPLDENHPLSADYITSPYGKSKYFVENILKDVYSSDPSWNIIILRYFNPVGAHESGLIGEDPKGIPNCLMPFISQVAVGILPEVKVFGNDYNTIDGSGVRDYIHVCDVAEGHSLSFKLVERNSGLKIYNLGTGKGYSVFQMINSFEKISGKKINYKIVERRPGDIDCIYAESKLAEKEMGWFAKKNLEDMCKDLWHWQSNNPNGYENKK